MGDSAIGYRTARRRGRMGAGLVAAVAAAALAATACGAPAPKSNGPVSAGDVPDKPSKAVTLNILDVAGNLQLTQGMLDNFVKQHGDIVSKITTSTGKAPDLAGKVKAQEDAGRLDIDVVLTGTDGLSAGIAQNLWTKMTDYSSHLSNMNNYTDPAQKMQELAEGYGVELVEYPSGPLLEYNPTKVTTPPTTTDELLAWCKAHPGRFQYAVPKNSGPGRTLLMGLPYILGDSDPKNPDTGWDKTWAYLKELGQCSAPYESGTANTMTNIGKGTVDMIASTTGWDINPRVLGTVPNTTKITTLKGFHWVTDAQYAVVPKGIDKDKLSAILNLLQFMLTPEQQAISYDKGYFYPGPAVKDVTLSMAPQSSQDAINKYGRPEYDALIANNPQETSLPADKQVAAFAKWDTEIGAAKK
ncbi:extracellular solute-binding protein [Rugosimonospora africana]|uniref:ABC transporter substrate-binding protein n=1 Tax=Rugosimonospora africana TaxID=556532 RepID=A0A8J3R485_9ACTN|nr:extracellular solute-binding protein [Rugosimonospora africana]GIH21050.1 ABC transporter substrate-binding protein [Rugosimonospora africana]